MKFCKYCGIQVPDDAEQCPGCGKNIGTIPIAEGSSEFSSKPVPNGIKHERNGRAIFLLAIFGVAAFVIVFAVLISGRCEVSGCNNKVVSGTSYCYSHKCVVTNCHNSRFANSNYCYSHYLLYDDDAESSYKSSVYSYELKISNIKISSNSSYTIVEGSITNNSDQTVKYVKIKGSFEDSSGKVVDTDWTYAVGSEGLEPGESSTWRMSVKKDSSIKDCSVTILDFDY